MTHVYFTVYGDMAGNGGAVYRALLANGVSELIASGQSGATGITLDQDAIYWTNSVAGTVMKRAK